MERTGYTLDVTTGQRKYGGPPPGWEGPTPGNGCEVIIDIKMQAFETNATNKVQEIVEIRMQVFFTLIEIYVHVMKLNAEQT